MRKQELKRLLSGLLAAVMVLGLIPVLPGMIPTAAAATDAYGFDLSTPDSFNPKDASNPYGRGLNGTEAFNFNPMMELNVYEGGSSGQNSATYDLDTVNDADNLFGSSSLTQISSALTASAKYTNGTSLGHTSAVAFDPTGSGRDDYIMYYGFNTDNSYVPSTILTKANASSGGLSAPQAVVSTGNSNPFNWVQYLDRDNGTGYTAIAAGDFDGDGSATEFGPNMTTNRAMIVTMLYRLEGEPTAEASGFTDVATGAYYADAVAWAQANNIVNGITETSFAPNDPITREQMAAILYRYAQYKGYDVSAGGMSLSEYADASQISAYATTAMQWANENGLITGVTNTTLEPQGSATRAQVATILMRFCEDIAK